MDVSAAKRLPAESLLAEAALKDLLSRKW